MWKRIINFLRKYGFKKRFLDFYYFQGICELWEMMFPAADGDKILQINISQYKSNYHSVSQNPLWKLIVNSIFSNKCGKWTILKRKIQKEQYFFEPKMRKVHLCTVFWDVLWGSFRYEVFTKNVQIFKVWLMDITLDTNFYNIILFK